MLNEKKRSLDEIFDDPPDSNEIRWLLVAGIERDGAYLLERLRARD